MFARLAHINYELRPFAPGWFSSPWNRPTFWNSFPWSPVWKIYENGRFKCPCGYCYNSALRAVSEPRFAAKCCPIFVLEENFNSKLRPFESGCFLSPWSRPTFWSSFPWSPLCKILENGRFRCPCWICHNLALRAVSETRFAAKCCPMFAH